MGAVGSDDPVDPVRLTGLEQFVVRRARSNRLLFVLGMTLPVCLVSVGLTVSFLSAFGAFEDPGVWQPSLVAGFLIPASIAPPLFSYLVSIACRIDEVTEQLQRSAHTDPLTATLNRRGFFSRLAPPPESIDDAWLLMVDLDDFKNLNDTHGHDVGDRALVVVAEWLHSVAGPEGVVGRFGGDEFVCVSTDERARELDRRQAFDVAHRGSTVPFTASIGLVRLRNLSAIDDALRSADAALYEQKANRRHQTGQRHANA